jgi:hypothetical protein
MVNLSTKEAHRAVGTACGELGAGCGRAKADSSERRIRGGRKEIIGAARALSHARHLQAPLAPGLARVQPHLLAPGAPFTETNRGYRSGGRSVRYVMRTHRLAQTLLRFASQVTSI